MPKRRAEPAGLGEAPAQGEKTQASDRWLESSLDQATGEPPATPERAAEIAELADGFGLAEFIALTGVGEGVYGPYRINHAGVAPVDVDLATLPAAQQLKYLQAKEALSLPFPCSARDFADWYGRTRGVDPTSGKPGPSDFPLAPGFLGALGPDGEGAAAHYGRSVTADAISSAFQKRALASENKSWWAERQRSPERYGLIVARAVKGDARNQSKWYPVLVGAWLIEKNHMPREKVIAAIQAHFPDAPLEYL